MIEDKNPQRTSISQLGEFGLIDHLTKNFAITQPSTLKGIGPTYMDKTGRNGLRVGDIFMPNFIEKYQALVAKHVNMLRHYEGFEYDLAELEGPWMEGIEVLRTLKAVDSEHYLDLVLQKSISLLLQDFLRLIVFLLNMHHRLILIVRSLHLDMK